MERRGIAPFSPSHPFRPLTLRLQKLNKKQAAERDDLSAQLAAATQRLSASEASDKAAKEGLKQMQAKVGGMGAARSEAGNCRLSARRHPTCTSWDAPLPCWSLAPRPLLSSPGDRAAGLRQGAGRGQEEAGKGRGESTPSSRPCLLPHAPTPLHQARAKDLDTSKAALAAAEQERNSLRDKVQRFGGGTGGD